MTIETASSIIPSGKWTLVPEESHIGFEVTRAGIHKVKGKFKEYTATVHAGDTVSEFSVEAVIQAASFDSGDADRDEKVKSAKFFNVAKYPELKFNSTELKQDGDNFQLTGHLTIHGFTKYVTFDVKFKGLSRNEIGYPLAGFDASTVISRKDFGLEWDSPLDIGIVLSDKVHIELDLLFVDESII